MARNSAVINQRKEQIQEQIEKKELLIGNYVDAIEELENTIHDHKEVIQNLGCDVDALKAELKDIEDGIDGCDELYEISVDK